MGRIIRNILVAAIIVSMMGVTAYAVGGFIIFDSPEEMLTSIFGDQTGFDHAARGEILDKDGNLLAVQPRHDRVPVDETVVAEDVAPHVSPVGQSISWKGYTLTVDAYMYDNVTKCGLVTYSLENPNGVKHYELQYDGEVWFPNSGDPVSINQYYNNFIVKEKSSDTILTVACYFQFDEQRGEKLEITLDHWAAIKDTQELMQIDDELLEQVKREIPAETATERLRQKLGENFEEYTAGLTQEELETTAYYQYLTEKFDEEYTCPDTITVDCNALSTLDNVTVGAGSITITPICLQIDVTDLEFLHEGIEDTDYVLADNVDEVTIRYTDGTEYVVESDTVMNSLFAHVTSSPKGETGNNNMLTFMFNRIIDIDKVESVIVNGTELTVDEA